MNQLFRDEWRNDMKCEMCKFLIEVATENEDKRYCNIFGKYVPEPFLQQDGCNLTYKEAQRLKKLLDDILNNCHEQRRIWFSLADKKSVEHKKEFEQLTVKLKKAKLRYEKYLVILKNERLMN